jgi:hypothetical protein
MDGSIACFFETTADSREDVADVLQTIVVKND